MPTCAFWGETSSISSDLVKKNYKSILQEKIQKETEKVPIYRLLRNIGSAHNPEFIVQVSCGKYGTAEGSGKTIRKAEQVAAKLILVEMMGEDFNVYGV